MKLLDIFLEKFWGKKYSIAVATLLLSFPIIQSLPDENESWTRFYCTLAACILALLIYIVLVIYTNKLPRAKQQYIGVLFIINAADESKLKEIKANLVDGFNAACADLPRKVQAICVSEKAIKKFSFNDKQKMLSLLQKTNCFFGINVLYQVDDISNTDNYAMTINVNIKHPKFIDERTDIIGYELTRIKEPLRYKEFNKNQKLPTLRFTINQLKFLVQYLISLVLLFTYSLDDAIPMLEHLIVNYKEMVPEHTEKIKQAYFVACLQKTNQLLRDYKEYTDIYLQKADTYLMKANSIYENTYSYHIIASYLAFVKSRDVKSAKNHIEMCKPLCGDDEVWKYNDAFICAYEGNNASKILSKYKSIKKAFAYNVVDIIEFIEHVLDEEPDKYMLHFSLGWLYNNLGDRRLANTHYKEFKKQYPFLAKEKNVKRLIDESIRNTACEKCDGYNCEVCEKEIE